MHIYSSYSSLYSKIKPHHITGVDNMHFLYIDILSSWNRMDLPGWIYMQAGYMQAGYICRLDICRLFIHHADICTERRRV